MTLVHIFLGCLATVAPSVQAEGARPNSGTPTRLQIVLPGQVGPIVAGRAGYSDVIKLLGKPEFVESGISKATHGAFLEVSDEGD